LSRRRIAKLAGVTTDTVTSAFHMLAAAELMQTENRRRERREGGFKTYYRLSAELYPRNDADEWRKFPAELLYGGHWCMLPQPSARHAYIALLCLDPIADESAYLARLMDVGNAEPWWEERCEGDEDIAEYYLEPLLKWRFLNRHRAERATVSLSELSRLTAMPKGTVTSALQILTTPVFGGCEAKKGGTIPPIPLVARGPACDLEPTWYVPDQRAWEWDWRIDVLNDPKRVEMHRLQKWPSLSQRRRDASDRTRSRNAKAGLARKAGREPHRKGPSQAAKEEQPGGPAAVPSVSSTSRLMELLERSDSLSSEEEAELNRLTFASDELPF
jgi:hypothetical protein